MPKEFLILRMSKQEHTVINKKSEQKGMGAFLNEANGTLNHEEISLESMPVETELDSAQLIAT